MLDIQIKEHITVWDKVTVQGHHGRFLAGKMATMAATLQACLQLLFRKIQARQLPCRSHLSWQLALLLRETVGFNLILLYMCAQSSNKLKNYN